ncbi:lactonase family protein [Sediminibacterium goheungense]|uniref:6-phosphogluconolactonase n=1 Tax=Sediminibacterium goheungense TaxID=1086393 RepID=A0A4R6IWQ9_9BACT|nr:lactonase family protein [Sediminibacterium goheungense]TDO27150.1 6-phosphogluconolactonase [Sediminibacterium goheungense]
MRLVFAVLLCFYCANLLSQDLYLFVGTYTSGKSKGIYVFRLNSRNGEVQWVSSTDSSTNPSFLSVSPDGTKLYAVNETGGDQPGYVSAFDFDQATGQLYFMNAQPSGGDHPCFITVDKTGKWVLTGNYTGGNLSVFPVNKDGGLSHYAQLIQHTGSSVNKSRQTKPHVHATFFSPDDKYVLVPDLGMDKVMVYQFDPLLKKPLKPAAMPFAASAPGSGPRHLDFHPNQRYVYVLEELSGTIKAYRYTDGFMTGLQTITTHPVNYTGEPGSADIHVSPDGKFLYASNRGEENNLAIFSIDQQSGKLTAKGYQAIPGAGPRNFTITPNGNFILVANQKTNNIVIYRVNKETGALQQLPRQVEVPNPVCLKLIPAKQ